MKPLNKIQKIPPFPKNSPYKKVFTIEKIPKHTTSTTKPLVLEKIMKKNKLTPEETIIIEETLAVLAERDPELLQEWLAVALRMLGPSLKNLAKTHGPKNQGTKQS